MGIRGGDFVYIRLMLGIVTCGMGVWKKLLLLGQRVGGYPAEYAAHHRSLALAQTGEREVVTLETDALSERQLALGEIFSADSCGENDCVQALRGLSVLSLSFVEQTPLLPALPLEDKLFPPGRVAGLPARLHNLLAPPPCAYLQNIAIAFLLPGTSVTPCHSEILSWPKDKYST